MPQARRGRQRGRPRPRRARPTGRPKPCSSPILDPSRAFEAKYAEYTVHLADGRVRTGMIASETASALTLRRQQGEQDVILRADIEAMAATGQVADARRARKGPDPARPRRPDRLPHRRPRRRPRRRRSRATGPAVVDAGRRRHARPARRRPPRSTATRSRSSRSTATSATGSSDNDRAAWRFNAPRGGPLRGLARPGLRPDHGRPAARRCGRASETIVLPGRVDGLLGQYRRVKVGEITLPAGPGRLDVRPDGPLRGPLARPPRGRAAAGRRRHHRKGMLDRCPSKPTDVRPVAAALYFLPIKTRMPLKFGPEVTTEVTCARVRLTVRDASGRTADGWGETPLSVQWVWPSALSYEARHEVLKRFCRRLDRGLGRRSTSTGHPIEVGQAFIERRPPRPAPRAQPRPDATGRADALARGPGLQLGLRPRPARRLRRPPRRPDLRDLHRRVHERRPRPPT